MLVLAEMIATWAMATIPMTLMLGVILLNNRLLLSLVRTYGEGSRERLIAAANLPAAKRNRESVETAIIRDQARSAGISVRLLINMTLPLVFAIAMVPGSWEQLRQYHAWYATALFALAVMAGGSGLVVVVDNILTRGSSSDALVHSIVKALAAMRLSPHGGNETREAITRRLSEVERRIRHTTRRSDAWGPANRRALETAGLHAARDLADRQRDFRLGMATRSELRKHLSPLLATATISGWSVPTHAARRCSPLPTRTHHCRRHRRLIAS